MSQKYCPSCGEMTDTFVMLKNGREECSCASCGIIIPDTKAVVKKLKAVLAAEDTPVLLRKVAEMLEVKGISQSVIQCKNGEEFLSQATSRIRAGLPVDLAVLDVQMPILNGINAAVALRAIERARKAQRKIPILFFTSTRCDETFQQVLKHLTPARYINKGVGTSPEEFAERLYLVVAGLLGTAQ